MGPAHRLVTAETFHASLALCLTTYFASTLETKRRLSLVKLYHPAYVATLKIPNLALKWIFQVGLVQTATLTSLCLFACAPSNMNDAASRASLSFLKQETKWIKIWRSILVMFVSILSAQSAAYHLLTLRELMPLQASIFILLNMTTRIWILKL